MIVSIMLFMIGQILDVNAWYYFLLAMVFLGKTFLAAAFIAAMMKE